MFLTIGIEYHLFDEKYIAAVTELSNRTFCENNPLPIFMNTSHAQFESMFVPHIREAAKENLSVIALKDGRVIGAVIAIDAYHLAAIERDEAYTQSVAANQTPIINLLTSLYRGANLPMADKPNVLVSSIFTAVETDYLGYEVSYTLEKLALAVATQQKFTAVVTELTNTLSQASAKDLGFKLSDFLVYDDFVDPDTNQKPFLGMPGGAQLGVFQILHNIENVSSDDDTDTVNIAITLAVTVETISK